MTPAELELIRREVRTEIRTAALLDRPVALHSPPPSDLDAERTLLATMFEGHAPPPWLWAKHFDLPFHQHVFDVLSVLLDAARAPDVDTVVRLTRKSLGWKGGEVEGEIANLATVIPAQLPLEPLARRIVSLSSRRAALFHLAKADALLRLPVTDDSTELEHELRAAIDLVGCA